MRSLMVNENKSDCNATGSLLDPKILNKKWKATHYYYINLRNKNNNWNKKKPYRNSKYKEAIIYGNITTQN